MRVGSLFSGIGGFELADTPRYRMLGNAVSVPVAEWIGRRIIEADTQTSTDSEAA